MHRLLRVTTAATATALTTLTQLKAALELGDDEDDFYTFCINTASDEIASYLGRSPDQDGCTHLGRETISETLTFPSSQIVLGRWPVAEVVSVTENGTTLTRLLSISDAAMTSASTTLTSASSSFTSAYVGKAVTVSGAGASGATLTATIASVTSATAVVLSAAAGTTVSAASATIEDPAWPYYYSSGSGVLWRMSGAALVKMVAPTTIVYKSGWLLPGETGRTLPRALEDACILLCQAKINKLQAGANAVIESLNSVDIDGVGNVQFGKTSAAGVDVMPYSVRSLLEPYAQPTLV